MIHTIKAHFANLEQIPAHHRDDSHTQTTIVRDHRGDEQRHHISLAGSPRLQDPRSYDLGRPARHMQPTPARSDIVENDKTHNDKQLDGKDTGINSNGTKGTEPSEDSDKSAKTGGTESDQSATSTSSLDTAEIARWSDLISTQAGMDQFMDKIRKGDKEAIAFLKSPEGRLLVQQQVSDTAALNTLLTNLMKMHHDMVMAAVRNIRA
jgi:hypothetical protein